MKTITFKSDSQDQIDHLLRLAAALGIETVNTTLNSEETEPHAPIVGEAEMDAWLTKEGGEKYTEAEVMQVVNNHLHKLMHH